MAAWATSLGAALAFLVPLLPAAAGPQGHEDPEPAHTNQVKLSDLVFQPAIILVGRGTTVTWTNLDSTVHSISAGGDPPAFDHDPILPVTFAAAGANRVTQTFDDVGAFPYHCKYHSEMSGEVRVVETLDYPPVPVTVTADHRFSPPYVAANASQPILWTNPGAEPHRIVFEDLASDPQGDLGPRASYLLPVEERGSYRYRCERHSLDFERGMVGKLKIGPQAPEFPPITKILGPTMGTQVSGIVTLVGSSEQGLGDAFLDTVEVRVGPDGPWLATDHVDYNETTIVWEFEWDTREAADGLLRLYARGLSGTHRAPAPTWVEVKVHNGRVAAAAGDDGWEEPGRIPAFSSAVALAGLVAGVGLGCRCGRRNL